MNWLTHCPASNLFLSALLAGQLLAFGCDEESGGASDVALAKTAWAATSACGGAPVDDEVLELIYYVRADRTGQTRRLVTCAADASDCTEFFGCFYLTPSATCSAESPPRCDGNAVVRCVEMNGQWYESRLPCGADGSGNTACTDEGGSVTCSSGRPCTGYQAQCEGSTAVSCNDGIEERYDCAAFGLQCLNSEYEGDVFCGEKSKPCQEDHCDGGVLVSCAGGYEQVRFDCGSTLPGTTCREDTSDPYWRDVYCAVPEGAARCQDDTTECAGAVARACVGGAWLEVDCSTFGNAACFSQEGTVRCVVD